MKKVSLWERNTLCSTKRLNFRCPELSEASDKVSLWEQNTHCPPKRPIVQTSMTIDLCVILQSVLSA